MRIRRSSWLIAAAVLFACAGHAAPGLILTCTGGGQQHASVVQNVALYVGSGETPSPFVPVGPFTATWEGAVSADLRGEFFFRAETQGLFKLEINGQPVLELSEGAQLSDAVPLSKGANRLKATFTRPAEGEAWLRLAWTEKGTNTLPIPNQALTHTPAPGLEKDLEVALGRELFVEHRCIKCHDEKGAAGVPELAMDAPSFEGIGARRNTAWMAKWILDPKAQRASAQMPRLVSSREEAQAIAAYLGTLKTGGDVSLPARDHKAELTPPLFHTLLCASCHTAPDVTDAITNTISLRHVAAKFPPGKLAEFLRAPEAHFAWTRMPNFNLNQQEAEALASELLAVAPKDESPAPVGGNGKELVQTRGCLSCHQSGEPNRYQPPAIRDWTRGCLGASTNAPQFGFKARERRALQAFGKIGRESLARHVPSEFAERQTRLLNCAACHGRQEGFPPLDILGGKLRPEWSAAFIAGHIGYKPRAEKHPAGEPWLAARMPAFRTRATHLAQGLTAQHGFAPRTPPNPAPDPELVKAGRKLVGKDGGFSCVSCHAVREAAAAEVFESEGINLAYSAERLLPEYYRRWLRNPLSIDPQTKMPVYFEDGRSPLTEILDGDAEKQIEAMWHYLLLGDKMPVPNLGEAQ